MKKTKRNIMVVTVLLFVCAAIYLNWSYNNSWGKANEAMVKAEDAAMEASDAAYNKSNSLSEKASSYFADARLNRQVSRDEALNLLEDTAVAENASQEAIDSAMDAISVMATYSMQETQIENMLIAKDFADCVVYMTDDAITVAVPAPKDGLDEASVAKITETVTTETEYTPSQLKVIEITY